MALQPLPGSGFSGRDVYLGRHRLEAIGCHTSGVARALVTVRSGCPAHQDVSEDAVLDVTARVAILVVVGHGTHEGRITLCIIHDTPARGKDASSYPRCGNRPRILACTVWCRLHGRRATDLWLEELSKEPQQMPRGEEDGAQILLLLWLDTLQLASAIGLHPEGRSPSLQ